LVGVVVGVGVVLDNETAGDLLDHGGKHVLSDADEVVVVSVGHVELAGSVLGVVGLIDGFISEVLADLEDALQAADHQLLEEELRSNPHEEFHVEVVVVGGEGLGSGSSRNHVHHWGLNLDEVHGIQVPAHEANHFRPHNEGLPSAVVHDQVQVALPVPVLAILEAGVGVRQHVQTGGEELEFSWSNGKLFSVGLSGPADDSDDVSPAEGSDGLLEAPVALEVVGVAHDLHAHALLLDVDEDQVLALAADVGDSAGKGDLLGQPLALHGQGLEPLDELVDGEADVELVGVGIGVGGLLQFGDHFGAIFEVLGGVKDFLLLGGGGLILLLLCLLGSLHGLLRLQLLELLQTFLLVLAQLGTVSGSLRRHFLRLLDLGWVSLLLLFLSLHN
jgi:hypothetical protein